MSTTIGRIVVPVPSSSGLTFPFKPDFGYGTRQDVPAIQHRFGSSATLANQFFQVGVSTHQFTFRRANLNFSDWQELASFWESCQGSYQTFLYYAPNADQSYTEYTVKFADDILDLEHLISKVTTGIRFLEIASTSPTYTVNSTCVRFPNDTLATALTSTVNVIVPLCHIRVKDSDVPDIYLSDRLVTVGSNLYQPRWLNCGEKGKGVLLSQSIEGKADAVNFEFANADRVFTQLMNDCDLKYAEIDISLFHVGTGILLQLWQGFIVGATSDGTAVFKVNAADGLYQTSLQYPTRTVSRTCWKTFNDGVNCPYAANGSLNPDFPNASTLSCDYYWNSPNGCQAHNMTRWFGGHPANPQGVQVQYGGSIFGIGRNKVTSTSLVSDTVYGAPLQRIYCNQGGGSTPGLNAFIVNAMVFDVRDQGSFFDVAGIVGAGPIGAYTIDSNPQYTGSEGFAGEMETNSAGLPVFIGPTADGFPAQGYKTNNNSSLGLRQVIGNDPIPSDDEGGEQFGLTPASTTGIPFAAGTAFVELLYPKPTSFAPSTPDQHSMQVPIAQGLTCWNFAADGTRTSNIGETNPFWVALDCYFDAIGIKNADAATQLDYFVLSSLVNEDGVSGCVQIADLSVASLIDSDLDETQFQFQGVIGGTSDGQKPFRDWLTEILSCALGYYTFEFGKLKFGIRENASAVSTFTLGNMLYQSLTLEPIDAQFENLTVTFADVEYQYQSNTAEYQDKSHAAYYGRPGTPLSQQAHSVGLSTLSQATRIAATRVREEVGGIVPAEWIGARTATWKTTILALDTEVGQVVSITHPDLPFVNFATLTITSGGSFENTETLTGSTSGATGTILSWDGTNIEVTGITGTFVSGEIVTGSISTATGTISALEVTTGNIQNFRIKSWALNSDYSISITGTTVTQSMYDLDMGPKPLDVQAGPLPVLVAPVTLGEWAPYQIQAPSGDPTFPNEYTFDVSQTYMGLADGTYKATVTATGVLPVNQFITEAGAPVIHTATITQSTTGGYIPGGIVLRLAVCGTNASGTACTPPSPIIYLPIPSGTDTNTISISNIVWPVISGLTGYVLFASPYDDLICMQSTGALSGTPYSPTNITFDGPLQRSTWGIPNQAISNVVIKGSLLVHGGVQGSRVDSVTPTTITCLESYDAAGIDNWTGRTIIPIGRFTGSQPFASWTCTGFDPSSGTFTLDPSPMNSNPVWAIQSDDAIVVCFQGYDNSSDPTVFTDSGISNSQDLPDPHTGETTNSRVGMIFRVLYGTGRGSTAHIVSNTATSYTLDTPILLDATSIVIIHHPTWEAVAPASSVPNGNPLAEINGTALTLSTANYLQQSMLIGGLLQDNQGNTSNEQDAILKMVYIYGQQVAPVGPPQVTFIFGQVGVELSTGLETNHPSASVGGIISGWTGNAVVPTTGQDFIATIYQNGTSIGTVTLTAGDTLQQSGTFDGTITVSTGDVFWGIATQVGNEEYGQAVTIELYWEPQVPTS